MAWDWHWLSHPEWVALELVILAVLVWQLVAIRRERRAERQRDLRAVWSIDDDEDY
jgi:hypothetical protein